MKNIPEKIYLQLGFEPDETDDFKQLSGVTWAEEDIHGNDLEYLKTPEPDFLYFTKEARDEFVKMVQIQEWSTPLRTAAENLLIAYDQMNEKLKS